MKILCYILLFFYPLSAFCYVQVGIDVLVREKNLFLLKEKSIGLITNQSAVNKEYQTTFSLLKKNLTAVFAPEHGFYGAAYADEKVDHQTIEGIPLYSLHGEHKRPTSQMLKGIDLLIYDIQDLGSRSYTFLSTLFYCMEEAASRNIEFLVLDRPNPMGGVIVDGPAIEEKWRSFLGYVNIPYCHGMTIGELALFFNKECNIGCKLTVIPMKGWKRGMIFSDTGLPWVPTSPQIPEPDTPFYYPTTGILGHCSMVNIGIGYTLPFKVIGAPWIEAHTLATHLNKQKLPGVYFQPYYFRPFFGKFKLQNCQGVRIVITNPLQFTPITTQFTIMGILKNLYPKHFETAIREMTHSKSKHDVFNKLNGSESILNIICNERFIIWKLREKCVEARKHFLPIRKKYLIPDYEPGLRV